MTGHNAARWPVRPLAECGCLLSGGTPSKSNAAHWEGAIPWYSSKELKSFELSDSELHVSTEGATHGSTLVPPGTVLFVVRGMSLASEFRVSRTLVEATFNQDVKAVVPAADMDSRYLARCLRWLEPNVLAKTEESSHGTKRLPSQVFESLPVPVPPLAEQHRIADILEKADSIRRKRKKVIALTEELLRSAFLEVFGDPVANPKGWPMTALGEHFAVEPRIGTLVPASDGPGTVVVRVGELGAYDVDLARSKRAPLSDAELARFGLTAGDVLLARAIGSMDHLGKASVLQVYGEPVAFDSHVMRLRFRDNVLDPYVFVQWLRSSGGRARFLNEAGRTAVQFNVNGKQIAKVQMPLPPRREQRCFREVFDSVRTIERGSYAALREADTLFNALVAGAFSDVVEAPC